MLYWEGVAVLNAALGGSFAACLLDSTILSVETAEPLHVKVIEKARLSTDQSEYKTCRSSQ